MATQEPSALLRLKDVLALTTQSQSGLYRGMAAGTFPRPVKTPSGKRWRRRDIELWLLRLKPAA